MESIDRDGETPLAKAAATGNVRIVNYLLQLGADVNGALVYTTSKHLPNARGNTPLINAVAGGHRKVVRLLLNAGACAKRSNREEWTPLHFASASATRWKQTGSFLLNSLIQQQAHDRTHVRGDSLCHTQGRTALQEAVRVGNMQAVRAILKQSYRNNRKQKFLVAIEEHNLLHFACEGGSWKMFQFLMLRCPDKQDWWNNLVTGRQSLLQSVCSGHHLGDPLDRNRLSNMDQKVLKQRFEIVRCLISKWVGLQGPQSADALVQAAKNGYRDIVRCLLMHGATITGCKKDCSSPIPKKRSLTQVAERLTSFQGRPEKRTRIH